MSAAPCLQEKNVSAAFSRQSAVFDELDKSNPIILNMRKRIYEHLLSLAKPGGEILELNAGTGIDAIFLAQQGFRIHAVDNAQGMLDEFSKKITSLKLQDKITFQKISFNRLDELSPKKYDHIFSNFGGLNCTENLEKTIQKFPPFLHKNGMVTLVIMPPVCPWEILLALKGNFKTAFRRFSKNGTATRLEGVLFKAYYYSPLYVQRALGKNFKTVRLEGLASLGPPPYLENFSRRFPSLYRWLAAADKRVSRLPPFRSWADHYIISLKKTAS